MNSRNVFKRLERLERLLEKQNRQYKPRFKEIIIELPGDNGGIIEEKISEERLENEKQLV